MMKMTKPISAYAQQLKSPHWQRRRLEILERANFECQSCGDKEKTLHVHHRIYRKGAKVWEYADCDLECLCEDCHAEETLIRGEISEAMAKLDTSQLEQLLGFAKSMLVDLPDDEEAAPQDVVFRSYEEAHGMGLGFGLQGMETDYVLTSQKKWTASELFRLKVACFQRNRARTRLRDYAQTADELVEIASDALKATEHLVRSDL